MKIGFAGTPVFASAALEALFNDGHEIKVVLTQPDRPAGRGMKLMPSPVKQFALAHDLLVLQPSGLRLDGRYGDEAQQARDVLLGLDLDVLVVAAYGLILPRWVLDLPRLGCLNIHASLLPRWRGAAPIQRAIEAGDAVTGISIMQMDEGLDTGDVLLTEEVPIGPEDNAQMLHDRLAECGARLIVQALRSLQGGGLTPTPQPEHGVTYAQKLDKSEALLDMTRPAAELACRIRAFDPVPGAKLLLPAMVEPVKVFDAVALDVQKNLSAKAGQVVAAGAQGIDFATGQGVLRVRQLQKSGGKRQDAAAFLAGHNLNQS